MNISFSGVLFNRLFFMCFGSDWAQKPKQEKSVMPELCWDDYRYSLCDCSTCIAKGANNIFGYFLFVFDGTKIDGGLVNK